MNLSARQLAEKLGVSHTAVNRAASNGRIEREPDGGFDPDKCRIAWNANVNIHQQARGMGNRGGPVEVPAAEPVRTQDLPESELTTAELQRREAFEALQRRRRENQRAAGELVNKAETSSVFSQIGKIYASARDSLPVQLAAQLVGKRDLDEIERIISSVLEEADSRICDEIESRFPNLRDGNDHSLAA